MLLTKQTNSNITEIENTIEKKYCYLDKNEQSCDVDKLLKAEVLNKLKKASWNRYPTNDYSYIEQQIALNCGLKPENIVLASGAANIITTMLNYYALNNKDIVIVQPSYRLFDFHCKTHNINYTPWDLTSDLEYDLKNIPKLTNNSVLLITSPNNPVGNSLKYDELESILKRNPNSIIVVDAVYQEFGETDITPLLNKHKNLIILRSFSKAFPFAGLRLGYLCANSDISNIFRKLILQYSINHFSIIAAETLLFNHEFVELSKQKIKLIKKERNWLYTSINNQFDKKVLSAVKSEGNFILVRVFLQKTFDNIMQEFQKQNIKILNTSNFPLLNNSFRVSIGSREENETILKSLLKIKHEIT